MDHYGAIPQMSLDENHPRFDGSFVYAGTAAYSLTSKLLTEAERERIIGAENVEALVEVLRETYFGSYLAATDGDVDEALTRAMASAKHDLQRLSPNPHLLNVLWLRYDFYNLKTLLKRQSDNYDDATEEDIVPLGTHTFQTLEKAVQSGNAAPLHNALAASFHSAPKDPQGLENYMEVKYLEAALEQAENSDKPFAVRYVRLLINLFTILSCLRAHARGESPTHIPASDCSAKDIQNVELLFNRLSHIGFSRHWNNAIDKYRETNNFSELDKAADDYLMKWLKRQSIVLHSPAPMFAFWHVFRENVQLIRAALTAKKVGMDEKTLREIIRTSYNAYVY